MDFELNRIALEHGYHVSSKSVPYKRCSSYNFVKKIEVAAAIQSAQAGSRYEHLNISSVSRECKFSRKFVRKIVKELTQFGKVLIPEESRRQGNSGPGARTLDEVDLFVILVLYMEEPSRSLHSYVSWLQHYTGMQVSTTLLGQLFKVAFPFSGGLYLPNLILFDKF